MSPGRISALENKAENYTLGMPYTNRRDSVGICAPPTHKTLVARDLYILVLALSVYTIL